MRSLQEKEVLPQTYSSEEGYVAPPPKRSTKSKAARVVAGVIGAGLLASYGLIPSVAPDFKLGSYLPQSGSRSVAHSLCEQADFVFPKSFDVSSVIEGHDARIREWLMGAVRVPTEIFDVMGPVGEDPRWDVFYDFSACECRSDRALAWAGLTYRPREGFPLGVSRDS